MRGDPTRLRQILTNLVGNAIKFTERGEVVVRVKTEKETADQVLLHFAISDTGVGIPPEKQHAIFHPFTQADSSTTRKFGGSGLGLTISSRLLEVMHGRIWVESKPGKGSTFHCTACFALQTNPRPRIKPADVEKLHGLPILVVDDNHTNRRILRETLLGWEMQPTLCASGKEALALLQAAKARGILFSLILVDAHMPEMDGFTFAKLLQNNPYLPKPPLVMLTSGGLRGDAARCRELGVRAYLTKPVRSPDLLETIQTVLGKKEGPDTPEPFITKHTLRENRARLKILLAEDNAVNQLLAARVLEKRGHEVVVVATGKAALEKSANDFFHVILMDVQMPEMDGLEATVAIRAREQSTGGHVPIIAMTAHAMVGDKERCLASGMDAYISKPLQALELFQAIEALVPTSKPSTI